MKREAEEYDAAGPRPEVVWPNGVLASTAVGVVVSLLPPWHRACESFQDLEYDGNLGVVRQDVRMTVTRATTCHHHPADEVGDPLFDVRSLLQPSRDVRRGQDVLTVGAPANDLSGTLKRSAANRSPQALGADAWRLWS